MRSDLSRRFEYPFVQRSAVAISVFAMALLLVSGVAIGGGTGLGAEADGPVERINGQQPQSAGVPGGGFAQMDIDPDDVLIEAAVEPDGAAVWTIEYRVRLTTDEDEQAFAELAADIEDDPASYTDRFRERMVDTADAAETATGREMSISDTTVSAEQRELPQSYGVVTYQFRWNGFAAVADDDRIGIGDAIDGLFLDDASSLILSWPAEYELVEATPSPSELRETAVVWAGPTDFRGGEPRVTVEPAGGPIGLSGVLIAVLVVAIVGTGAFVYRRRRDQSTADRTTGDGSDTPTVTGPEPVDASDGSDEEIPSTDTESATANTGGAGADYDGSGDAGPAEEAGASAATDRGSVDDEPASPVAEDELLSNEEQVLRLIESQGGRMKQKRVVEELGWTAAKTSQVVTGLRDEERLEGFRLGRENVLSLPEFDATDSGADAKADTGGDEAEAGNDDDPPDSGSG